MGTSGKRNCHRASSRNLNVSTDEAFTFFSGSWCQYKTNRPLNATGLTPLLVNLESMTPKTSAGGGSKDCVAWKFEKAMHDFVHADNVIKDFSTN